jgi:deoxyribonuclease V
MICGLDCSYSRRSKEGRMIASAVLLRFGSWESLEESLVEGEVPFPYIPGLLSFRELPLLLEAIRGLRKRPDIVLVDGAGIAHPRRLGLAAHLGVVTGLATIGVAKSRLCGAFDEPGLHRGDLSPLFFGGEQVGTVLRSREAVRPLFVSPGHRVSLESAPRIVLDCCGRYRLPEPTRQAHGLVTARRAIWKEEHHGTAP